MSRFILTLFGARMRNQYLIDLEKQLDRLWVGKQQVLVLNLGKDKYILTDGARSVKGKGADLVRPIKKLRDRCGVDKFWGAMQPLGVVVNKNPAPFTPHEEDEEV